MIEPAHTARKRQKHQTGKYQGTGSFPDLFFSFFYCHYISFSPGLRGLPSTLSAVNFFGGGRNRWIFDPRLAFFRR
ncbi:MAG: hypothetical protein CSB33_01915 [Desulfobacterales bacterium]|nr:MAG: hypothetical protein CSB33_01915 [Desulfobacterales bacterium]